MQEIEVHKGKSFSCVLSALKKGMSARLPHWKQDVRIMLQVPDEHSKMTAPYLYVHSRFGCVPWIPTQIELLSEEWEVIMPAEHCK